MQVMCALIVANHATSYSNAVVQRRSNKQTIEAKEISRRRARGNLLAHATTVGRRAINLLIAESASATRTKPQELEVQDGS